MIHTAQIFTDGLSEEEYNRLTNKDILSGKGIRELIGTQYQEKNGETKYRASAIINLQRIATGGKSTVHPFDYTDPDKIENLKYYFSEFMKTVLPRRKNLDYWQVSRIDYTFDHKTPYFNEYINLLSHGDCWWNMEVAKDYTPLNKFDPFEEDDPEHPYLDPKDKAHWSTNVKYRNTNAYKDKKEWDTEINIYAKQAELENKEKYNDRKPKDAEDATNLLRIEVAIKGDKKYRTKQKYGIKGNYLRDYFDEIIERELLLQALKRLGRTTDYYTRAEALKLINGKNRRTGDMRDCMKQVIDRLSAPQAMLRAEKKDKYIVAATPDETEHRHTLSAVLNSMDGIGVNPVTIPAKGIYKKDKNGNIIIQGSQKKHLKTLENLYNVLSKEYAK